MHTSESESIKPDGWLLHINLPPARCRWPQRVRLLWPCTTFSKSPKAQKYPYARTWSWRSLHSLLPKFPNLPFFLNKIPVKTGNRCSHSLPEGPLLGKVGICWWVCLRGCLYTWQGFSPLYWNGEFLIAMMKNSLFQFRDFHHSYGEGPSLFSFFTLWSLPVSPTAGGQPASGSHGPWAAEGPVLPA